ncbi:MAG: hypothetical protein GY942_20090 [Aestuariibacter sp.]|nr:hypothetical protein [Aestuariibacter sp.]
MANKNWSEGLLGNPMFMMGLAGLANQRNPAQGWMQGLLANNQYAQGNANRASQKEMHDLKMQQIQQQMAAAAQPAPRKVRNDVNGIPRYEDSGGRLFPDAGAKIPKLPAGMVMGANGPEYMDAYLAGQTRLKQAGRNNINVNTGEVKLPTDQEIMRGDILDRATKSRAFNNIVITDGRSGIKSSADYRKALSILDGVETGTFEETKLAGKKLGAALGFDVDMSNVANAEQLMTLLGDQVMARVGETKGAVSEKEMDLFTRYSANYGNTTEGNRRILQFKLEKAQRDIALAKIVRNSKGKTSIEVEGSLWDYINENPIGVGLSEPRPAAPGAGAPPDWQAAARAELQRRKAGN